MGNPDGATLPTLSKNFKSVAQRVRIRTVIPRLVAHTALTPRRFHWYQERYDVDIDPETEAIVTIGSSRNRRI